MLSMLILHTTPRPIDLVVAGALLALFWACGLFNDDRREGR